MLVTVAASACSLFSTAPARAQSAPSGAVTVTPDAEARRSSLYRDGVASADAGRWEDAVAKFREVIAIRSAPPALFTLGQAEEHVGHFVSAKRAYAKAQVDARAAGSHDVASAAQKALAAVEPHIAHLTIKPVPSDGASATLDGSPAPIGEPVEVDPGEHQVNVTAPRHPLFASTVRVNEGEQRDVSAMLGADLSSSPPPPVSPAGTRPFPIGPVALGGAGVALGIVALIVRQTGQSSFDTASSQCSASGCPSASVVDQGNSARSQILAGDVTLGVGLAAVAAAATWWLVTPKTSASGSTVGFDVMPGPSGLRAGVSGRW